MDTSSNVAIELAPKMSISQLRTYCKVRGISMVGCVEKSDLVALVIQNETSPSPKMPKTTTSTTTENKKSSTSSSSTYSSSTTGGGGSYSTGSYGYGGSYTGAYGSGGGYTGGYPGGSYPSYTSGGGTGYYSEGTAPAKPKTRIQDDRCFYEILGVEKTATPAQIKKGYYKMARKYHPDKNPDDEVAEEMFKLISEAYDILSNDEKRAKYDKYGKEYIRTADSGGGADIGNLLKLLFGGGQFDDVFGELSILEMLQTMDVDGDSASSSLFGGKDDEYDAKILSLAESLRSEKLAPYIEGNEKEFKIINQKDIDEKMLAPGGPSLLTTIGYVYIQIAKIHSERWFGLESFVSGLQEKGHLVTSTVSIINDMRKMAKIQADLEGGEGAEAMSTEAQQKAMDHGLSIMWKMGKLEIESTVKAVCNSIIKECKGNKSVKKRTVAALKILGNMYVAAGKQAQNVKGKKSGSAPTLDDVQESLIKDAQKRGEKERDEESGNNEKKKSFSAPNMQNAGTSKFPPSKAYTSSMADHASTTTTTTTTKKEPEEDTGDVSDMDGLD